MNLEQQPPGPDVETAALATGPFAGCRAPRIVATPTPVLSLLPPDFDLIIDRTYVAVARNMAEPALPADASRYTIFDPIHQVRVRLYRADQRLEWLVADVLRATPAPLRAIQLLDEPLYGFPEPQLVLTYAHAHPAASAVPVDCRAFGRGVCTAHVMSGANWAGLGDAVSGGWRHAPQL